MRTGQVGTFFGLIADRHPSSIQTSYLANAVAPHALVARGSVTIPVGNAAMVYLCHGWIRRNVAAAPVDAVKIRFVIDLQGTSFFRSQLVIKTKKNVVNDEITWAQAPLSYAVAGDILVMLSEDLGTGGSLDYDLTIAMNVFDAG